MRAFSRPAEVVAAGLVVLLGVALTGSALTAVGGGSEQATCAARLALFGQASAHYETVFGTFVPCDPWPMMPYCADEALGLERRSDDWGEQFDPAHNWLAFYGLGLRPNIPYDDGINNRSPWNDYPFGFTVQTRKWLDRTWNGFFCPSQNVFNTQNFFSLEIDFSSVQSELGCLHPQASGYMVNRLLRSPARDDRRLPRLPGAASGAANWYLNDNVYTTPSIRLNDAVVGGANSGRYYIQGINNDELVSPTNTAYLADSLDYGIGSNWDDDVLVDSRFGNADVSAGTYMAMNQYYAKGVVLGARHGGRANVLYADGHVGDENQQPRNMRGDMTTASTFADFLDDAAGFGSQHHVSPGYRFYDPSPDQSGGFAPGDDLSPTVVATTPEDGGGISTWYASEIRVQFSEAVLVNETNITVNGGAIVPMAVTYDAHSTSAVLTFEPKLEPGEVTVEISPAVTDVSGNQLDGNGDGTGGDGYTFSFAVRDVLRPYSNIQLYINERAVDGDVIVLRPEGYAGPVYFAGKKILITSEDPRDPGIVRDTDIGSDYRPAVIFNQGEGRDSILQGVTIICSEEPRVPGIEIEQASPTIRQCVFKAGKTAILCTDGSPLIDRCVIRNVDHAYGAIACYGSDPIIRNCIFIDNVNSDMASCLYLVGPGQPLVFGNTFVGNTGGSDDFVGSTVFCFAADAMIEGNLFWQNYCRAVDGPRDIVAFDGSPSIKYNFFDTLDQPSMSTDELVANHNVDGDPLMDWYSQYDYWRAELDRHSPCVNAGKRAGGILHGATDVWGGPRLSGIKLDIGAEEIKLGDLTTSDPVADSTLSKSANNVMTLNFSLPIMLRVDTALHIRSLGDGQDLGDSFTYVISPDELTLTATENGAFCANQMWYRVTPAEEFLVEPFELDVCKLIGDASGDGRVMANDLGVIWSHNGEVTDSRFDINGDGRVMAVDIGVTWPHNGERVPGKP